MIYYVEDDASIRELVLYTLRTTGFEAKGFENGAEFLKELEREYPPELILLDIMLPDEDGISILRRIKAEYPDIPVIMVTAKGTEYDKVTVLFIIDITEQENAEQMRQEFEAVRLDEVCNSVIDDLKAKANGKDITLECSAEKVEIKGVRPVLYEMIYNLCDNGIIYNKSGGFVRLTLQKSESGCILAVSDNGIGIPAEHHSRIFERFYRVDKSRSKERGGTGLGLSIVKHGAALHNGEISLESEVNKGTTIEISFNLGHL